MAGPPRELEETYAKIFRLAGENAANLLAQAAREIPFNPSPEEMPPFRIDGLQAVRVRPDSYGPRTLEMFEWTERVLNNPESERRIIYDDYLAIVRLAYEKLMSRPRAVTNQLKVERLLSGKHPELAPTLRPFLTESQDSPLIEKSKALTDVGRSGVRDFSPGGPSPPPGGAGPAAAGAGGPAGGRRRRKTTRLPSRSSRRRRSKRSQRNRGGAKSL
jgi:hypothetical protein